MQQLPRHYNNVCLEITCFQCRILIKICEGITFDSTQKSRGAGTSLASPVVAGRMFVPSLHHGDVLLKLTFIILYKRRSCWSSVELDFAAERTVETQVSLARKTTARQTPSIKLSSKPHPLLNGKCDRA